MDIQMLARFFMWCTVINVGLLTLTFLLLTLARDFVYEMHGKWFPMPKETFNVVIYSFIGMYKIIVIVFNIVPWVALSIIS